MNEKVLGFKEKDAIASNRYEDTIEVIESKLVPVVSVEWLKRWCKKKASGEILSDFADSLLEAAHKQVKRGLWNE